MSKSNYINIDEILQDPVRKDRRTDADIYSDRLKKFRFEPLMSIKSLSKQTIFDFGHGTDINEMFESVSDWGFLNNVKYHIEQEISNITNSYEDFMISSTNLSPREMDRVLNYYRLRLRRLNMVCKPDFGTTIGRKKQFLKKENRHVEYEYDMTKIYWFDDSGDRVRKISKNFGRKDEIDFERQFGDYLLNNVDGLEILDPFTSKKLIMDLPVHYIPDLVVRVNGEIWFLELKNNKGDLIETFIMFELWDLYKETYGI